MNTVDFSSGSGGSAPTIVVTRVAPTEWHAVQDGQVIGEGDVGVRPGRRAFLSIDAWESAAFDRVAEKVLADVPAPLFTLVDEADSDAVARWEALGFVAGRREAEYLVPTDPQITGLGSGRVPSGVRILSLGTALREPLLELEEAIRAEVGAGVGWNAMPAEIVSFRDGSALMDPSKYAVAAMGDQYVGLVRLAAVARQPRIGLIAVLAAVHRRGVARALLADVLGSLHRSGVGATTAEVDEANVAAKALFESVSALRRGGNLEMLRS